MTFRQFAFNNVLRNKRIYIGHYLSSTFAVMIFFIYGLLAFHPSMQGRLTDVGATMDTFGRIGFQVSQYLTYFFSIFFVLYSVSAFLKKRKIEFGILTVLGLSPRQLNKLIFTENMLIGFASIVTGVGLGIILTKLILLMSATVLAIGNKLPFYFPIKAIWVTALAFSILFLLVSYFISKTVRISELVELIKSKEKPLPEPKSSIWLAVLAVVLTGLGYGAVFYFATVARFSFSPMMLLALLITGVALVVIGTYYLFTQLSVYVLKSMKRRPFLYFKKTNLLTLSELTYRMKENAKTFFLVTIISTAAFTAIGVSSAMGDALLKEFGSPYAITYEAFEGDTEEAAHIAEIEKQLELAAFPYTHVSPTYLHMMFRHNDMESDSRFSLQVMRLSNYNEAAQKLGNSVQVLGGDQESFVIQAAKVNRDETPLGPSILYQFEDEASDEATEVEVEGEWMTLNINKLIENPYLGQQYGPVIVVSDQLYEKLLEHSIEQSERTQHGFVINNWQDTLAVSKKIADAIHYDIYSSNNSFYISFLSINWQLMKQVNGILSILTVLVGIVFFVFACSFLYFRLFTDLDKDQEQYRMLSKIGLSFKELNKVVLRQMGLLFFLPMVVAIIHSCVAFAALQKLLRTEYTSFSVVHSSIIVLGSFLVLQIIYFYVLRRNYLRQLYSSM
jgi:putative ABC transport system permease protein